MATHREIREFREKSGTKSLMEKSENSQGISCKTVKGMEKSGKKSNDFANLLQNVRPCKVGFNIVVRMFASQAVGLVFASRPSHTKGHRNNGSNCLPAWPACVRFGA